MTHYVGLYGLDYFDLSMALLKEMTKRFTSEFGVRFFLIAEPEKTLKVFRGWTSDENRHVRRLVSEGSRPRLPWAMRLPAFIENPEPVISLLDILKDDGEEYVRRSVANNLNDIAKDHPNTVAKIAVKWLKGADENRKKLIRHGCRSLIKNGHKTTLSALGYSTPLVRLVKLSILNQQVKFGEALVFELTLRSTSDYSQDLIIDYAIHHQKANGTTAPKVFKWKIATLAPTATFRVKRRHAIRKITTRVYYPGTHQLEIFINGQSIGRRKFDLKM